MTDAIIIAGSVVPYVIARPNLPLRHPIRECSCLSPFSLRRRTTFFDPTYTATALDELHCETVRRGPRIKTSGGRPHSCIVSPFNSLCSTSSQIHGSALRIRRMPADEKKLSLAEPRPASPGSSRLRSKSKSEFAQPATMASGTARYARYILFAVFVCTCDIAADAHF